MVSSSHVLSHMLSEDSFQMRTDNCIKVSEFFFSPRWYNRLKILHMIVFTTVIDS